MARNNKLKCVLAAMLSSLVVVSSGVSTVAFAAEAVKEPVTAEETQTNDNGFNNEETPVEEISPVNEESYAVEPAAESVVTSGTCGKTASDNVIWNLHTASGTLTISGTGAMADYIMSGNQPWKDCRDQIKKIVIEDGVTYIGSEAFINCPEVLDIIMSDTVTALGNGAIKDCGKLLTIDFSDSLTEINYSIGEDCDMLMSVTIPDSVKTIKKYAFYMCNKLKYVYINGKITSIEQNAFNECPSLSYIYMHCDAPALEGRIGVLGKAYPTVYVYGNTTTGYEAAGTQWEKMPKVYVNQIHERNIVGVAEEYTVTGEAIHPEINVIDDRDIELTKDIHYTVSYGENTELGTGTVTVTCIDGFYSGIATTEFEIVPEKVQSAVIASGTCSSTEEDNVTWSLDENGLLTIGGTGNMADYSSRTQTPWYAYYDQIKSVLVETGVNSVGAYAFEKCASLLSVTLKNGVKFIDVSAFSECENLQKVNLTKKSKLESLGYRAFAGCKSLKEFTIPAGVRLFGTGVFSMCSSLEKVTFAEGCKLDHIGESGFSNCGSLKEINLPDTIYNIEKSAFYSCSNLENITIPDRVSRIEDKTFFGCRSLKFIKIPEKVTFIGTEAFCNCKGLTEITIPAKVQTIKPDAFYKCTGLNRIYFECAALPTVGEGAFTNITATAFHPSNWEDKPSETLGNATKLTWVTEVASGTCGTNAIWTLDDSGILIISGSGDMTEFESTDDVPWEPYFSQIQSVVIEDGITSVAPYSFNTCVTLTSVSLPNSVTKIGTSSFFASSLTEVTLPENLEIIGDRAFAECTKLTAVSIPDSVTEIGAYAFSGCRKLASVKLPENITMLNNYVFHNCDDLEKITLPASVKTIGNYAFAYSDDLKAIYLTGDAPTLNIESVYGTHENFKFYVTNPDAAGYNTGIWAELAAEGKLVIQQNLSKCTISGVYPEYTYTGSAIKPKPSVRNEKGQMLIEYTDYEVSYSNNTECGTATVTVSGKGKYNGELTKTFKIVQENVYSGTCSNSTVKWFLDSSGTLTLSGIGVTGNNYSESNPVEWHAYRDKIKNVVVEKGVTSIGGYTFYDCQNLETVSIPEGFSTAGFNTNAFVNCPKLTTVTLAEKTAPGITNDTIRDFYSFNGVSKNLQFIVTAPNPSGYDKNAWAAMNVICIYDLSRGSVSDITEKIFTGDPIEPDMIVTDYSGKELVKDTDYTVSYQNNVNVGTATVTLTGKGNYTGTLTKQFDIGSRSIEDIAVVTGLTNKPYTGSAITQDLTISIGSTTLKQGTDYTVKYQNNIDVGTALLTITGTGNYRGEIKTTFNITNPGGMCGANAYWEYDLASGTLTISGSGKMDDFGFSNKPWYQFREEIQTVTVSDQITRIGADAFSQCTAIKSVDIADSVTEIGSEAFGGCSSLKNVILPKNLKVIESVMFAQCTSLEQITIPNGVEVIKNAAFHNTGLRSIVIPNSVTEIWESAFNGSKQLASVTLSDNLTAISESLFNGCSALERIVIPEGVTSIGYAAFSYCTALTSADLPESIEHMETDVFYECPNLGTITLKGDAPTIQKNTFEKNNAVLIVLGKDPKGYDTAPWTEKTVIFENSLDFASISDVDDQAYTGSAIMPEMKIVTYLGKTLVKDTDYSVTYENNTTVGTATVIVTGIEDYSGEVRKAFEIFCGSHIYSDWIVDKNAGCMVSGSKYRECLHCKDVEREEIPSTGHSHKAVVTAPTCENGGYTTYTCSCGDTYVGDETAALNHKWDDGVVTTNPTCTTEGEKIFTCQNDKSHTRKDSIPSTGHSHKAVVTAPTCENGGYTTYTCSCGDTYVGDKTAALSHKWDDGVVTTKPTCTTEGEKTFTCQNDKSHTYKSKVNALDHNLVKHDAKAPTYTQIGWNAYETCTRCDHTTYQEIPMLKPTDVSKTSVSGILNKTYTGSALTQKLTVKDGGKTLVEGTDYTVTYKNNVNVGTATVTITGKGDYTGSVTKTFTITAKKVSGLTVFGIKDVGCTATAVKQKVTVTDSGKTLKEGTDYTVSYKNNAKPGKATVTITGKGNYTGTVTKNFTIANHTYDNNVDGKCNICGVNRENVEVRQVTHMFRMYNPNTGEHFYTGSEVEKGNLVKAGWKYEGVGFTFPANTGAPVHRLFQPSTGEHLYTMNENEKSKLMKQGWNYEGVAFNSAYDTEAVQYRLHNPNAKVGAYHFTFSQEERQNLLKAGWEDQGIGWYSCWK